MSRYLPQYSEVDHGRRLLSKEPLVYHCNFYNYWLQKTLLLDESLGMAQVIQDAATEVGFSILEAAGQALQPAGSEQKRQLARDVFADLGFGTGDFSELREDGGTVKFPVSHYGGSLRQASGVDFAVPQSLFDAGYAAAVAAFLFEKPAKHFEGIIELCQSRGAEIGMVVVRPRQSGVVHKSPGLATYKGGQPQAIFESAVDEPGVLKALAGLDLAGNEEGLIPRFGLMLTNHFANFYNRISFEFTRKMGETDLLDAGEMLLTDAGYRCAFHTFGGIMVSAEWDAVVLPQLRTKQDWVHGMVAVINALGWGVWRVAEISDERLVVRIWDDYESCGYLDMYGKSARPVSHLAAAATAGMMNLVHVGNIANKPELSVDFYNEVFERDGNFRPEHVRSIAQGDEYTEIVACR